MVWSSLQKEEFSEDGKILNLVIARLAGLLKANKVMIDFHGFFTILVLLSEGS